MTNKFKENVSGDISLNDRERHDVITFYQNQLKGTTDKEEKDRILKIINNLKMRKYLLDYKV